MLLDLRHLLELRVVRALQSLDLLRQRGARFVEGCYLRLGLVESIVRVLEGIFEVENW